MSVVRRSIFTVALMASGAAYAGTPGWSVSESSGPVFVAKPGLSKTSAVTRGAALSAGDVISTGKGGRAIIVRGGEYLTVAPNTKVQLTEPKAGALTQIIQSFGNVVFKIQKKTTPHFQVDTPYLAAVVKGTTFSVTVTPAGASVQVTEGLVQVQSLDGLASRFVSPGEIGMISSAAPGQLSVLGAPNAPSSGAAVIGAPAAPAAAPVSGSESRVEPAAATVSEIAEVRIASPIGEGNVNLAAQTGGIVSGNSSLTQAAIVEAVVAQPSVDVPATPPATAPALAEVAPPAPVVEAPPTLVAETAPAPAVVETPAAVVAEVTPPAAAPAVPPVLAATLDTPGGATPSVPAVAAENANLGAGSAGNNASGNGLSGSVETSPAPAVVETPAAVVAEVTPPAAAPAVPPVLAATLETPGGATPSVPAVAAENANLGAGASGNGSSGSGNGSSGSGSSGSSNSGSSNSGSSNSGSSNSGSSSASSASAGGLTPVKLTSLSDFLKALREAAKLAAASQSKSGRDD